jgi:hypothetical protein
MTLSRERMTDRIEQRAMRRDNADMEKSGWWALGACAAVIALVAVLFRPVQTAPAADGQAQQAAQGLPWQVELLPDGSSRVMGLHLGQDTLAQVRERAGDGLQVALVAPLGEVGALEALAEPFNAAFISGRLVLSFDVPASTLRRWREGAVGSAPMEGGIRRFALRAEDLAEAQRAPLVSASFVPLARLAAADVSSRFGPPEAERALEGGATWMVYPRLGVAATVAAGQRGVIQYVAPRDAARLGSAATPASAPGP